MKKKDMLSNTKVNSPAKTPWLQSPSAKKVAAAIFCGALLHMPAAHAAETDIVVDANNNSPAENMALGVGEAYMTMEINSGGTATDTTINSGGRQTVNRDGTATGTTINSGGAQGVNVGGKATKTTINEDGVQWVNDGGTATGTTINEDGFQYVQNGGTAEGTDIQEGGVCQVPDRDTKTRVSKNTKIKPPKLTPVVPVVCSPKNCEALSYCTH